MTNEEALEILENLAPHCDFADSEVLYPEEIEALNIAIKALAKHDYFIEKIHRESYIQGYNKAMSNILIAYNKSDYPEYTEHYIYQELNKWEKEGVPNEQ